MKKMIQFAFCCLVLLFFSACSSLKITTDYDRSVDFTKYQTFDFIELDVQGAISELNQNRFIAAIKAEMEKKGFKLDESDPDMLVNATAIIEDKQSVTADTYGYGGYYRPYRWGGGVTTTNFDVYEYKTGSLIIDVIDASTRQLIWEGTGNKEIDTQVKDPDAAAANVVARIMAGFPPVSSTQGKIRL
ncbi:MAG TPA: DUF4136 domain-containing protein [Bacteroidales bacterium]|nr:DUF4136 domain-containing protein [Bacteroidales bacterium]HNS46588.1 DUF4136 domain-containing protein [Bacteroidales bacterium]